MRPTRIARFAIPVAVLAVLPLGIGRAAAQQTDQRRVTAISPGDFRPAAVNDLGIVAGVVRTPGHARAALWYGGRLTYLDDGSASTTVVQGINDRGQVVGFRDGLPVRWDHGTVTVLDAAHRVGGETESDPGGLGGMVTIGQDGTIVIIETPDIGAPPTVGEVWRQGHLMSIPAADGDAPCTPTGAVNALGDITAVCGNPAASTDAVVWHSRTQTTTRITLPGGQAAAAQLVYPVYINDLGQVAVLAYQPDGSDGLLHIRCYLWQPDGATDLGDLGGGDTTMQPLIDRLAFGGPATAQPPLNRFGAVAADSVLSDGDTHGVVWFGGHLIDLTPVGVSDSNAVGVNDLGWVIGTSVDATTRQPHGFVWLNGRGVDLGVGAQPLAVSDTGLVIGTALDARGATVPMMWTVSG